SEFSKGYFVNQEESVVTKAEEEKKAAKKKMTLMERLASMSPEEDAKKAKLVMDEVQEEAEQKENELEEALKKDNFTGIIIRVIFINIGVTYDFDLAGGVSRFA
ncbi:MAG: hypothetical protein Q3X90_05515, partial [Phascolarctobacterium sp.]